MLFITDELFEKRLKQDSIELFKKSGDDLFVTYLTTTRIIITSMIFFQKNSLSDEERREFGLYDDVEKCFSSIERKSLIDSILYLLSNYTYTANEQMLSDAYNSALKAYEDGYAGNEKEDVLRTFTVKKKEVMQQIIDKIDDEKFFNLYEEIFVLYKLKNKEKKYILKTLNKKFADLLVFKVEDMKKNMEKEVQHERNKKTVQKIYNRVSKKKSCSVGA